MFRSYKVQLNPNQVQISELRKNCGAARWAYNYALNIKLEQFKNRERISNYIELCRSLNKLKGTEALPWAYAKGISKFSFQEALKDCDKAFQNFFTRCKKKVKGKKGFPKFKSKKNEVHKFRLCDSIHISASQIKLPRLGRIKLAESNYIPLEGRILSATVSTKANKWFVSVNMEVLDNEPINPINDVIGIDLGIKTLATCSNGEIFNNPKALKNNLKRLKRKQRHLSRKKKGSKNREKARIKLSKLHYHISNIRKDCLHKITSKIIDENQVIVLEDLKVSNMLKNHKLAQAISDVGLYEFRRQITYKAGWNSRKVIFADTFFPSSKQCSCCGWKNSDLKLTDRVFECKVCDMKIDRDLNASLNLKQIYTGSSSGIQACGEQSSSNESLVSCSMKQEFNKKSKDYILKV